MKPLKPGPRRLIAGAVLSIVSFGLVFVLFHTSFLYQTLRTEVFQTLERKAYDILLRVRGERPHRDDIVLVRIDEYTINKMNNEYPLPRDQVGAVMTILSAYGAKAVALDVFMPPSRDSLENALMVEYLANASGTYQVIGAFIPSRSSAQQVMTGGIDSTAFWVLRDFGIPAPANHHFPRSPFIDDYPFDELASVTTGVGHTTLILDSLDGIMRSAPVFVEYAGRLFPSLGMALALHEFNIPLSGVRFVDSQEGTYVLAGPVQFLTGDLGQVMINFIGPQDSVFTEVSFFDILAAAQDQNEEFLRQFQNKICIIGPTAKSIGDYYSMPYSEGAPGYTAHANLYDTIVTQSFIYPAGLTVRLFIVAILVLIICMVAATRSTKAAVLTGFLLSVLYCLFAYFTFASGNRLYGVVEPLTAIALSFGISLTYRAATEGAQRRMITTMFEKYVDKAVVQQLIDDPSQLKLGGQTVDLTILFADIKGFTSISEQLSPANLVKLVNTYLTEMAEIIMKQRGTVDKFIGDAIMAFWGAPLGDPESEFRACVAALEMQKRLGAIQAKWKKFGNVTVRQRVGLNTGISLVGNMGSESKFNYTAVGDAVNLASRLEGVNKQYGTTILLSEFTHRRVDKKVVAREIDKVQVVGRTEPVTMYELMALADRPLADNTKYFLDLYQDGLKAYQTRKWDEGIAYFEAALSYMQNDPVSQMYIERMKLYKLNPPDDDWNGVFVLMSK